MYVSLDKGKGIYIYRCRKKEINSKGQIKSNQEEERRIFRTDKILSFPCHFSPMQVLLKKIISISFHLDYKIYIKS